MAMAYLDLADEVAAAAGYPEASDKVKAFSKGVVDGIKLGVASFNAGVPTPHVITGIIPATMAGIIKTEAGYPSVTSQLLGFCSAVATHIMTPAFGIVTYVGPPPPAVPNYFQDGTIAGLSGSVLAALMATNMGFGSPSSELDGFASAIANHVVNNAEVLSGVIS